MKYDATMLNVPTMFIANKLFPGNRVNVLICLFFNWLIICSAADNTGASLAFSYKNSSRFSKQVIPLFVVFSTISFTEPLRVVS